ncbi:MAG: OadG family protein [Dehalococcoidales bacterium]|nr:OadG family protein [Dehalococcoidales bacterium]
MTVDWGFAGQIGGIGFGTVFIVLIILTLAMWLMGRVFSKIGNAADQTTDKNQKGA